MKLAGAVEDGAGKLDECNDVTCNTERDQGIHPLGRMKAGRLIVEGCKKGTPTEMRKCDVWPLVAVDRA